MLLGRATYEEWEQYWPTSAIEPFAIHINGAQKVVVSTTLEEVKWGEKHNGSSPPVRTHARRPWTQAGSKIILEVNWDDARY